MSSYSNNVSENPSATNHKVPQITKEVLFQIIESILKALQINEQTHVVNPPDTYQVEMNR